MCNQNRKISISEDIHCSLEMNREGLAEKKEQGQQKETAGKKARFPEHELAKSLVSDKEPANKPIECVGNRHCR